MFSYAKRADQRTAGDSGGAGEASAIWTTSWSMQSQAGVDVVVVRGVIVAAATGNGLGMVTVVTYRAERTGGAGQTVPARRRCTRSYPALCRVSEVLACRLALTQFTHGLKNDPASLNLAKDIATRTASQSRVPSRAAEPVMLHNLLATIALLDG